MHLNGSLDRTDCSLTLVWPRSIRLSCPSILVNGQWSNQSTRARERERVICSVSLPLAWRREADSEQWAGGKRAACLLGKHIVCSQDTLVVVLTAARKLSFGRGESLKSASNVSSGMCTYMYLRSHTLLITTRVDSRHTSLLSPNRIDLPVELNVPSSNFYIHVLRTALGLYPVMSLCSGRDLSCESGIHHHRSLPDPGDFM
jgi:hypothetical protein